MSGPPFQPLASPRLHPRIVMRAVTKVLGRGRHRYYVLRDVDAVFDGSRRYVVLGAQGSGKTTLLRVLGGMQRVGRGSIERFGKVMPPLGMAHTYSEGATGKELCKIFAQLFDADAREVIGFTTAFSGLGEYMDIATIDLPAELRFRLSVALGYAVPADFYLFDGMVAFGTPIFRKKCQDVFKRRSMQASTIFATRDLQRAPTYGDTGVVIHNARLHMFTSVEEAVYTCRYLALEQKQGTLAYAEDLLASGDKEGARDYLRDSGLLRADDADANELDARIAASMGDDVGVEQAAMQALAVEPGRALPRLLLAQLASRRGAFEEAQVQAHAYLAIDPDHREARRILAQAYEGSGAFASAARVWSDFYDKEHNEVALRMAIRCAQRASLWEDVLALLAQTSGAADDPALMEARLSALIGLGKTEEVKAGLLVLWRKEVDRTLTLVCRRLADIGEDVFAELVGQLDLGVATGAVAVQRLRLIAAQLIRAAARVEAEGGPEAGMKLRAAAKRLLSTGAQPANLTSA